MVVQEQQCCIIQSKLSIGWNNFCLWRLKGLQKDEERKNVPLRLMLKIIAKNYKSFHVSRYNTAQLKRPKINAIGFEEIL